MKQEDMVTLIHAETMVPRKIVRQVLKEMALIVANELAGHEIAPLPFAGQLVPLEHRNVGSKVRQEVRFEPTLRVRKRMARPFRRLRLVSGQQKGG